jgi:molybdopterin converting factor small subunit
MCRTIGHDESTIRNPELMKSDFSDRVFSTRIVRRNHLEPTMPITVDIPPPLREQAGGNLKVTTSGNTVHEVLDDLIRQHPALGPKLFDNGRLRPHVNVLVNDEDIRYLDDLGTDVADGNVVALIPAVAGG